MLEVCLLGSFEAKYEMKVLSAVGFFFLPFSRKHAKKHAQSMLKNTLRDGAYVN
jgi:hypothetical protein